MPLIDFICHKCGFKDEFLIPNINSKPATNCPNCGDELHRIFSSSKNLWVDIPGGYDYIYGKKAWKKNLSIADQARVLTGEKSPY